MSVHKVLVVWLSDRLPQILTLLLKKTIGKNSIKEVEWNWKVNEQNKFYLKKCFYTTQ